MFDYWAADPDIQIEYGEPVYQTIEQTKALLEKYIERLRQTGFYRWAIVEKQSGHNIGQIAFCKVFDDVKTAEIEYCISKRFWGKGYAGEALAGLIAYAFEILISIGSKLITEQKMPSRAGCLLNPICISPILLNALKERVNSRQVRSATASKEKNTKNQRKIINDRKLVWDR